MPPSLTLCEYAYTEGNNPTPLRDLEHLTGSYLIYLSIGSVKYHGACATFIGTPWQGYDCRGGIASDNDLIYRLA